MKRILHKLRLILHKIKGILQNGVRILQNFNLFYKIEEQFYKNWKSPSNSLSNVQHWTIRINFPISHKIRKNHLRDTHEVTE
jgi:hypothetical protein